MRTRRCPPASGWSTGSGLSDIVRRFSAVIHTTNAPDGPGRAGSGGLRQYSYRTDSVRTTRHIDHAVRELVPTAALDALKPLLTPGLPDFTRDSTSWVSLRNILPSERTAFTRCSAAPVTVVALVRAAPADCPLRA